MGDVFRFDRATLRGVHETPQGFLRIPAGLTRVGVFSYRDSSGKTIRELRPADEVLSADSLDTLRGAPVTIGHQAMTNPENIQQHIVGTVLDAKRPEGGATVADGEVIVHRADAVSGVRRKELREISPGYTCRVDATPGVWEGQPYDRVQRNIRYNHIALLPVGGGRQGAEVALRMDAASAASEDFYQQPDKGKETPTMEFETVRITLDGIDFDVQVPKAIAPSFKAAMAKKDSERKDAADKIAQAEGLVAAAQQKNAELTAELKKANDPSFVQARVDERVAVVEAARALAPKIDCTGKTLEQIRMDALILAGVEKEKLEGKSPAFVEGLFTGMKPAAKAAPAAPGISPAPPAVRSDSNDKVDANAARERMMQRHRDAWKGEGEAK